MNEPLVNAEVLTTTHEAAPSAVAAPDLSSLLAHVLAQPVADAPDVETDTVADLLKTLVAALGPSASQETILRAADVLIARIEQTVERQTNVLLHHPRFQALESAWRGVLYLCEQTSIAHHDADDTGRELGLKLRLLQLSKKELDKDLASAIEFDQSRLFKFVYEAEYGTVGGQPFGLLIGDYEFTNHRADIDTLGRISQVAAAAFAPFVSAVAPQFFKLDDFALLERGANLQRELQGADYIKWRSLRDRVDTRFVALTLPRVLMREPYQIDSVRGDGFRFREDATARDSSKYLWGNAAYAFGGTVIRAYATSGWFADIRGFERGIDGGGLVTGLASPSFATDAPRVALKGCTDVAIGGALEKELSEHGFVPLCALPGSESAVFYTNPSLYRPRVMSDAAATANERLGAMLQYVLCTSRFAHFLKKFAQDKLGVFNDADELSDVMQSWIRQYVMVDERASPEMKARFPLRRANIQVTEVRGSPGNYQMLMELLPHYQLDDMAAGLRLVTRLIGS